MAEARVTRSAAAATPRSPSSAAKSSSYRFLRKENSVKPKYRRMSIRKLKEELKVNEHCYELYGEELSDGGARLEYTIALLKREIARAEAEIEGREGGMEVEEEVVVEEGERGGKDLSGAMAGLRGPSSEPLLKPVPGVARRRQQQLAPAAGRGGGGGGREVEDGNLSQWLRAEHEAKVKAHQMSRRKIFRPPPPMGYVSSEEGSRIMKQEQQREQEYWTGAITDRKHGSAASTPLSPGSDNMGISTIPATPASQSEEDDNDSTTARTIASSVRSSSSVPPTPPTPLTPVPEGSASFSVDHHHRHQQHLQPVEEEEEEEEDEGSSNRNRSNQQVPMDQQEELPHASNHSDNVSGDVENRVGIGSTDQKHRSPLR
eukprot:jgi/Bigna1/132616/aug1.18_g7324